MEDFMAALGYFVCRVVEKEITVHIRGGLSGMVLLSPEEAEDLAQWLVAAKEYLKEGPTG